MQKKIKISAVSYLNTKPFLYGLERSDLIDEVDLSLDIPADCATKLAEGTVDLGLVPVAVIPQVRNASVVADFCIGTEGAVKTVCIYSEVPIEDIDELYLDYQSRTSVALTKYLIRNHWQISPKLIQAKVGYERKIEGKTAALIIGDRTIGLEGRYAYTYDLGTVWKEHTGLPFVFAAWVSNKPLPSLFLSKFNAALKYGIDNRSIVAAIQQADFGGFSVSDYYYKYINYHLDAPKKEALQLFMQYISPQTELVMANY